MAETAASPPAPALSPALTMVLQARAVESRIEEALAPLDLSLRKLGILGHLRATPGLSFSALARRAGIKVQSLHPIIAALADVGYVRTAGEVSQGRSAAIEVTDTGIEAVQDAHHALREIDESVFADGDWAILGETLNRIAASFLRRGADGER